MGCAASRIENEDTVRRCKERRRLMKEAVHSRQLLASAHADYLRSMRLAAASLSRFAAGEPFLSISDSTPPVLLLDHKHQTAATTTISTSSSLPPPTPQPPLPPLAPHYSHASPTYTATQLPHILSRPTSSSRQPPNTNPNPNRPPHSFKVPHILSDSSPAPSTRKRGDINYASRTNLASTPSMSSSAWDWENFYPPSPPDSEFFERRKAEMEAANQQQQQYQHDLREEDEFSDDHEEEEEEEGEGEDEFEEQEDQYMYNDQLKRQEDNDDMTCREWDERYTSTSSSSTRSRSDGYDETRSRSEAYGYGYGYGVQSVQEMGRSAPTSEIAPPSSALTVGPGAAVHHRTLAEIAASIEEYFVKAAEAGSAVSELLETGRAQLDRSFSQLKSE